MTAKGFAWCSAPSSAATSTASSSHGSAALMPIGSCTRPPRVLCCCGVCRGLCVRDGMALLTMRTCAAHAPGCRPHAAATPACNPAPLHTAAACCGCGDHERCSTPPPAVAASTPCLLLPDETPGPPPAHTPAAACARPTDHLPHPSGASTPWLAQPACGPLMQLALRPRRACSSWHCQLQVATSSPALSQQPEGQSSCGGSAARREQALLRQNYRRSACSGPCGACAMLAIIQAPTRAFVRWCNGVAALSSCNCRRRSGDWQECTAPQQPYTPGRG